MACTVLGAGTVKIVIIAYVAALTKMKFIEATRNILG